MCRNHTAGGIQDVGFASRWQHSEYKWRVGNAMHGGRLYKRSAYRWHGLAALHPMMTVR
jgi:hypothetical protein